MVSATLRNVFRTLAFVGLTATAAAQTTSAQNDTSILDSNVQFTMDTVINDMPIHPPVSPLTDSAGQRGSYNERQSVRPSGPLYLTTAESADKLRPGNVAFISCEPDDYRGSNIGSTGVMKLAENNRPSAMVLYSLYAASCTFEPTDNFNYFSVYTMLDANTSQGVVNGLQKSDPNDLPTASIHLNQDSANGTTSSSGNVLGKSPTTAVAMIILYSITGIITALFLIIIVVGAVRAHRHPERYGPRHVMGRPRQSRAKGIARAMLDTLPIVKFGDREDSKPAGATRDLELAASNVEHREGATNGPPQSTNLTTSNDGNAVNDADAVRINDANGPEQSTQDAQPSNNPIDDGLACSVCTDDFVKGQDIRLLPCKHKFHPECIDPWLLNVSGTCPLCRIDLQPKNDDSEREQGEHTPTLDTRQVEPSLENEQAENTNADHARRNRRSRILSTLNIGRMRHATPQERLEALRTLRNEPTANAEDGARNRFSRRFSRALGSRPPSGVPSRPVSGVPPSASGALPVSTEGVVNPSQQNASSSQDRRRQGSLAG